MSKDQWQGCYDDGWQSDIVPEAFSHPAKFSRGLIHRIYKHAKEMGWFNPGDYCLDPFGGVALGGLDALFIGLNWIGVELEEKFVRLGEQNIELWNRQLRGWPNLGTARIVQGDSRRLGDVIREASLIVSSPPYAQGLGNRDHEGDQQKYIERQEKYRLKHPEYNRPKGSSMAYSNSEGQLSAMREGNFQDVIEKADLVVSSPPFCEVLGSSNSTKFMEKIATQPNSKRFGRTINKNREVEDYGHAPGNLANMKEGDIDLVVSSPPFLEKLAPHGEIAFKEIKGNLHRKAGHKSPSEIEQDYGQSPGQLGSMKEGSFDLIASSPPYEDCVKTGEGPGATTKNRLNPKSSSQAFYGRSTDNLGNSSGDTFWSASREIVQQCYDLLKDGGHAIWVTKDYVKKGQRVPFTDRWLSLCESVGFKLVCRHQSMLVKDYGTQITINGEEKITTERKSFFRRLAESKGSPRIDWEDVICMVKD